MIRIGLIGCGAVAESGHMPALLRRPDFLPAAVCDVRRDRAALLARAAGGVPAFVDWREMLEGDRLDAVALALPPDVSPDVAVECLRRGIPVLDEKPLASTLADGRRVAEAVARTGGVYQVGFVLRYGDWVRELRRLARAIGTPSQTRVSIFDERLDRSDVEHLGRIQGFLEASSAMTHEGSHVIDYASLWNPSPWTRVRAEAIKTEPDFRGPNHWDATFELADGSTLRVEIGWLLAEPPPCLVSIEGPRGFLELDPVAGVGRWQAEDDRGALAPRPLAPEWDRQYDAFAEAIARGVAEVSTVDDGLRALEATLAAEDSARLNRSIEKRGDLGIANVPRETRRRETTR